MCNISRVSMHKSVSINSVKTPLPFFFFFFIYIYTCLENTCNHITKLSWKEGSLSLLWNKFLLFPSHPTQYPGNGPPNSKCEVSKAVRFITRYITGDQMIFEHA